MTDERKSELRGLCEKATLGPWEIVCGFDYDEIHAEGGKRAGYPPVAITNADYNAKFIAAARTAVPELLDEIDALTAELAAMTRERDAAVSDLHDLAINNEDCNTCIHGEHNRADCGVCDGPCEWEWRGPVAAEGGKE